MSYSDLKLFALSSNKDLAEKVASNIGISLGKATVRKFSDGEIQVNIEESIRGNHVFILQSTSSPVNDHLMEILIMVDALKRASAEKISVVMPYYGYARQDRKARAREPITSKLVANMLEVAGVDRLLTVDLHAAQIQGFFDIPVDHLMGAPLIADYFVRRGMCGSDYVVVSPDHGGVTRARKLAQFLQTSIAIIDKRRSVNKMNTSEVMNIIGKVEGKTCILIDDMIDTAGTIAHAADALAEAGATAVYASCTHPVLSGPALDNIQHSAIEKLIVLDTIDLPSERLIDKIDIFLTGEYDDYLVLQLVESLGLQSRQLDLDYVYRQPFSSVLREKIEQKTSGQSVLQQAYHFPFRFGDNDYYAFLVFNGLLGAYPHSLLFDSIREKMGLAYSIGSHFDSHTGLLKVYAGIDKRDRKKVLQLINHQVKGIRFGRFHISALEETKKMLINNARLAEDNPYNLMELAYNKSIFGDQCLGLEEWIDRIRQITKEDVMAVAGQVRLQSIYFLEGE